jgi:hypothetical protein
MLHCFEFELNLAFTFNQSDFDVFNYKTQNWKKKTFKLAQEFC